MLVDTSVWVRHLREGDDRLAAALERAEVWTHPWVIGELACGRLSDRALVGRGIGWVDVQLLASALLAGVPLWTLDRRLAAVAAELAVAAQHVT